MNQYDKSRFDTLLEWSQQHGAQLHPDIEIYLDPVSKYSLRVKPSASNGLDPGFSAVSCPASTTLSYLNALVDGPLDPSAPSQNSQSSAFPPGFTQAVPPHVLGRFFLIKEYLKGKDSYWWPYIATLPSPDQIAAWALPSIWPHEDLAYLEHTNVYIAIDEMQANVRREFKQARKLLKEEGFTDLPAYTRLLYKWAFSIFTSRSFRPSLILSDTTKQHVQALLPDKVQLDDFSILQPLLDIANHSPTARYTWDTATSAGACQLVCHDAYGPGEQVYNNYGPKTNSELLLAYGFLLPETEALHNDYVHVRKRQPQQLQAPLHEEEVVVSETEGEPRSFLVSLRPMSHPSSLVGRARLLQQPHRTSRLASLPCFANFEPALVDDLAAAVATPEQSAALREWELLDDGDTAAAEPPSEEATALVEEVRGVCTSKVQFDYVKLMMVRVGGGDEEEEERALPPPGNRNQLLAVEYRRQCVKVLMAAMKALDTSEEVV